MAGNHVPQQCEYLGDDELGNHHFRVESGSTEGVYHFATIWPEGTGGVCSCKAYDRSLTCGVVEGANLLVMRAKAATLATRALDLVAGVLYNLEEGIDDGQALGQLEQLEAEVDGALSLLDGLRGHSG